jgi:hypothetical protein
MPVGFTHRFWNCNHQFESLNHVIFLEYLQHFQRHQSPWLCLLIFNEYSFLIYLNYCRENDTAVLYLRPHTTSSYTSQQNCVQVQQDTPSSGGKKIHAQHTAVTKFSFPKTFLRDLKKKRGHDSLERCQRFLSAQPNML